MLTYTLVYFLEVPLFVIKYMYEMISGSESEKKVCLTLKNGLSNYMHIFPEMVPCENV